MDQDNFEDWKICWQVNQSYYTDKYVRVSQKCVKCQETHNCPKGAPVSTLARRSTFWLDATRCSVGHRQALSIEVKDNGLGVCAKCDRMYVLELLKGKYTCRREGCRRVVRVNEVDIKLRLASNIFLFKKFQSVVKKHRTYECLIHCDDVPYDDNLSQTFNPPTSSCNHDRNVCDDCNTLALESAVRDGRHNDLVCLDPECKKPIPLGFIRSSVSPEVFRIHNKHLSLMTASKAENFRWCDCGHGQRHEPRDKSNQTARPILHHHNISTTTESNPEWFCLLPACKKRHCYICRSSQLCAHLQAIDRQKAALKRDQKKSAADIFLEEARKAEEAQKQAAEKANMQAIAQISKRCPRAGCPNKIERDEGCGHFTCGMCQTEFCWCCKVIWWPGEDGKVEALHLKGCKIGTNKQILKSRLDQKGYKSGWDIDTGYDLSLDEGLWLIRDHM